MKAICIFSRQLHAHKVYGPIYEEALIQQKKLLNLSEEGKLIPIENSK